MVTFTVPHGSSTAQPVSFRVHPRPVAFAGSRNGTLSTDTVEALIEGFLHRSLHLADTVSREGRDGIEKAPLPLSVDDVEDEG